nr:hypothetical protein [Tanacetum cinerariifolium]
MPTKIELTLEQSQQGVSNDVLTSNTLYNAIMEAGGKDRPPMLAPGNYIKWKSRIKRYIDTKPNHELIHYCLKNPSYKFTWADMEVPISEGIDNDIYSTVDACPNACEMWKAIERLKHGESINVQDLETNLYWKFGKFTSRDVSYHKLYDILKQHQNEVNELRAERIARTTNPLALVAQQQPVYHPQNHPTHYTQNSSTRSQQDATRNRGKVIVNSPPPIYDQEPYMVAEDDDMETVGTTVVQKARIQCYNCKEFGHVVRECQKPKRAKDAAYHREKMLLYQELEANYMYMAQIQEVNPDAAADSGPIFYSKPLQKVPNDDNYNVFAIESEHTEEQIDHNDDDDLTNKRELLAYLIEKQKCKINDNKNHNKFLETSNKVLVEKLKSEIEDFKAQNKSLESSNNCFKETNNKLLETNALMYNDLRKFQAKLDRRNDVEYASKVEIDYAKAKGDLIS